MQIKNKTSRILLMRRCLESGKEFDRERIQPNFRSKPFIATNFETIEIKEVAPIRKRGDKS